MTLGTMARGGDRRALLIGAAAALIAAGCVWLLIAHGLAALPVLAIMAGIAVLQLLSRRHPSQDAEATGSHEGTSGPGEGDLLGDYPPVYRRWIRTTAGEGASSQTLLERAELHWSWWQRRCEQTQRPLESVESELAPQLLHQIIARHEAAHALVGHDLGATVLELSYTPQGGSCMVVWTRDQSHPDRLWAMMCHTLAGMLSDQREGSFNTGSQLDLDLVQDHALGMISLGRAPSHHDGPLTMEALIGSASRQALQLLDRGRDRHHDLAAALLRDGRVLSGAQVAAILGPPTDAPDLPVTV